MKGRNTTPVTVRLNDDTVKELEEKAGGMSLREYIKDVLYRDIGKTEVPVYNGQEAGTLVRIRTKDGWKTMKVPYLDADNNAIPEEE